MLGTNQLAGFVAVKLHAIQFTQQIVGEFNVGFVDFVDQQGHGLLGGKGLPQHAFDDVVLDVLHFFIAQLRIAQTTHRVVLVQPLLGFGGAFDMPLQQRHLQCVCHFFGQHGFTRTGFAFDQ